jgi:hypothetical protein
MEPRGTRKVPRRPLPQKGGSDEAPFTRVKYGCALAPLPLSGHFST